MIARVVILAALCLLPAAASAQEATSGPPGAPGPRLRVTLAGTRTIGTLHAANDTSITLRTATGLMHFATRDIAVLEQSAGRRLNTVTAVLGGLIGVAIGGAIGCAANADSYGVFCGGQDDTKVVVSAAAGGVAGALLGGFLFKRERWESASVPPRLNR